MPELPEVETTVRFLRPRLRNRKISEVSVRWKRTIFTHSSRDFKNYLTGARFLGVKRRAKYIIFEMVKNGEKFFLLLHLRMSGKTSVVPSSSSGTKHDRVVLDLDNGKQFRFTDVRKFGKMYLVQDLEGFFEDIGPEPLSRGFTAELFGKMLQSKKGSLKPLLLNQSFLAGLGNIYVDESLWRAKIHPMKRANSLSHSEISKLHCSITEVLSSAIRTKGTDSGDNVVTYGNYTPDVYGRDAENCNRCKHQIIRLVIGQRGTHICPNCQRL